VIHLEPIDLEPIDLEPAHARAEVRLDAPYDLVRTLRSFAVAGRDRSVLVRSGQVWRATRTARGAATVCCTTIAADTVEVAAWGPGAALAVAGAPALLGALDDRTGFVAHHPLVRDLWRRQAASRMGASGTVLEALIPTVLAQKVTSVEAIRSYRSLAALHAEPAPGPGTALGLRLRPDPARLAELSYASLHRFGIERRRAETVLRACRRAPSLERLVRRDTAGFRAGLESLPGIGAWTSATVAQQALGDPDVVIVGDYHMPDFVAWNLAGEPRADDDRMLELLEPYRGQRGRVQRLLMRGGARPPAFGPRHAIRSIADI
jgi:3-methyladenine DNA glycosylase/8-oxoguanine DNA glycosylase